MMKQSVLGLGVVLLGVLVGCSDSSKKPASPDDNEAGNGSVEPRPNGTSGSGGGDADPNKPGTSGEGGGQEGPQLPDLGQLSLLMRRATSCEDLAMRAREQMREQLAEQIVANVGVSMGGSGGGGSGGSAGGVSQTGGFASGGGGGTGSSSGGAGPGTGEPGAPPFTDTNTQIANVDEPDFVKTDGKNLYVVQDGELRVATAFPATELAELASAPIQGRGLEMFLSEAKVAGQKLLVVYSQIDASALGSAMSGDAYDPYKPWLKVTVLNLAGPTLTTLAEYAFEGRYISARRTGKDVRQVLNTYRSYPEGLRTWPTEADQRKAELAVLEGLQAEDKKVADLSSAELDELYKQALVEVLNGENDAVLAQLKAEDFLPHAFVIKGDELEPANMACDHVFIPELGTTDGSITYVPQLDLTQLDAAPTGSALLGGSETIYQNASSLVLASAAAYDPHGGSAHTYLHAFELSGDEPLGYVGSGSVDGSVASSFSLDEQGGDFHVVTSIWDQEQKSRLYTLQESDGNLEIVGETPDIAPGESLRSVRFDGPTAYVVTFRNVDPLFVFDVSVPEQPTQLAELTIPGFSQYMHPIGDDKLLTIGSASGGWNANAVLRLFDVSDKAHPELRFSHEFDWGGTSEAQVDHHAFTYFAERELLAIPVGGYIYDHGENNSATYVNQLALLKVDPEAGFTELGAIDGAGLASDLLEAGFCSWDFGDGARITRGTFIDDTLYAVARHGIVAAKIATPSQTIATLPLAVECQAGGGGSGGGGTGGGSFGGAAGASVGGGSSGSTFGGTTRGGVAGTGNVPGFVAGGSGGSAG